MATRDEIFAAADRIANEGGKVTLEAVRQLVGGSYTTLCAALREWRSSRQTTAIPPSEPMPQSIADALLQAGGQAWAQALKLAEGRLAAEREQMNAARQELEAAAAEAIALADQLSAKTEALQSRLAESEAAAARATAEIADLRERLAASDARSQVLQAELDKAQQAAAAAQAEAAKLAGRLEAIDRERAG